MDIPFYTHDAYSSISFKQFSTNYCKISISTYFSLVQGWSPSPGYFLKRLVSSSWIWYKSCHPVLIRRGEKGEKRKEYLEEEKEEGSVWKKWGHHQLCLWMGRLEEGGVQWNWNVRLGMLQWEIRKEVITLWGFYHESHPALFTFHSPIRLGGISWWRNSPGSDVSYMVANRK